MDGTAILALAPATGPSKQDLTRRRKARKGFDCGLMRCNAIDRLADFSLRLGELCVKLFLFWSQT
jgi:hypothetical protein